MEDSTACGNTLTICSRQVVVTQLVGYGLQVLCLLLKCMSVCDAIIIEAAAVFVSSRLLRVAYDFAETKSATGQASIVHFVDRDLS